MIKPKNSKEKTIQPLQQINALVAGVDIGSTSHFIAISPSLDEQNVREVKVFTRNLKEAAQWLKSKNIQ
ncbi:MAG: IS110 family transposase, partial [Alphaproteobacteria bacterium]|nr:IS110 family transposase [Alphaproteobacteria bacterium]